MVRDTFGIFSTFFYHEFSFNVVFSQGSFSVTHTHKHGWNHTCATGRFTASHYLTSLILIDSRTMAWLIDIYVLTIASQKSNTHSWRSQIPFCFYSPSTSEWVMDYNGRKPNLVEPRCHFCFTSYGFGKEESQDRSWCFTGLRPVFKCTYTTVKGERAYVLIYICPEVSACVSEQIYAYGCTCDLSIVHPQNNQSQNAILPGAPHSVMTWDEEKAVSWRAEIWAEMRALTRDSGKEVSVLNGDF